MTSVQFVVLKSSTSASILPSFARFAIILEDDLETNQKILGILREIEDERKVIFGATILLDYIQTE